ncbi:MAG TPA: porin [Candidatus Kapabacteria bacterium]|nr:porin [Candidatus Kapabacteria bacterium]
MKVRLLPLAISAAIAMPGVALAEGPTVYGKLNVSYEMVDVDYAYDDIDPNSADRWDLLSNASRFGVKGDAAINDSLKAIYQIEWEVGADEGNTFTSRDRFVGLAGGFGTLQAGKFDSPLKKSQGKIDQFNDLAGDIKYVLLGEERLDNVIQYSTPVMGGFQGNIAFAPGEEYDQGQDDPKDGPADSFSLSGTFTVDALYLALAYDSQVATEAYTGIDSDFELTDTNDLIGEIADELDVDSETAYFDTVRLVAQYTMGDFQLGALYQMAETSDPLFTVLDLEQDGFVVSGAFTLGQNVFKLQYGASTTEANVDEVDFSAENDATSLGLGMDHKLSKQTTLFAYYNALSYEFDDEDAEEQTKDNLGVGIVHNF